MAQSVVVKKEEKVNKIFDELGVDCTFEEFCRKFKEEYSNDWERINRVSDGTLWEVLTAL